MITGLVDSNVIVDLLRKYAPADAWLQRHSGLGIARIVWFEVIDGALNKAAQREALMLLKDFEMVELTLADTRWAAQQVLHYRLSHNVYSEDCLIASVAYRLQLPLYTRNLKHFGPLLGALAIQPY